MTGKIKSLSTFSLSSSSIVPKSAVLLYTILLSTLLMVGCSDPMKQTIPTNADKWQDKLGDTFDELSEEDRQLLSRYMLRMKLSDAYQSGAMPRITVGAALKQQREYERLHPNNPTGAKSPINQVATEPYSITLLPIQPSNVNVANSGNTNTTDASQSSSINDVKLQFLLTNNTNSTIKTFTGMLMVKAPAFKQGKEINVPLVQFEPPIIPNHSGKIVVDSSIEDLNIMRAIKNPQAVQISITQGTLMLANNEQVNIP